MLHLCKKKYQYVSEKKMTSLSSNKNLRVKKYIMIYLTKKLKIFQILHVRIEHAIATFTAADGTGLAAIAISVGTITNLNLRTL